MMAPNAAGPAERLRLHQVVIWTVFAALLVLGVVLWLRYSNHIVPMLDVLIDR
jgi:hypothetical protein